MTLIKSAWLAVLCGTVATLSPTDPFSIFSDPGSGSARAIETGNGGKARINLSGKLRTLTQRIAAASCNLASGVETDQAQVELLQARGDFSHIINALEFGDQLLGVAAAESHPKALAALTRLKQAWAPLDGAVGRLLEGENLASSAAVIEVGAPTLLDAADTVGSLMSGLYADPATLLQVDAMAISIAGRQRMFSQSLRAEACALGTGRGDADVLAETAEVFEASLEALRDGRADAGVRPPPNEGIRDELDRAWGRWREVKPVFDALSSGGTADAAAIAAVNRAADGLLLDMDNIVTRYLLATPGSEDVYRVPLAGFADAQLAAWTEEPLIVEALLAQNRGTPGITQAVIDALDKQWRAETEAEVHPLIDDLMSRPASRWLQGRQAETAGFVTEVFVMDNVGLNVAQSAVTSDYWQGDEAKWQETYGNGSGTVHISEVEFDESTQVYQSQVSMPIFDPATGELIGAVTFGVNVQSLL